MISSEWKGTRRVDGTNFWILNDLSCLANDASIYHKTHVWSNHDMLLSLQFFKYFLSRICVTVISEFHPKSTNVPSTLTSQHFNYLLELWLWHSLLTFSSKTKKLWNDLGIMTCQFLLKASWAWVRGPLDIYHKLAKKKEHLKKFIQLLLPEN